MIKTEAGPFLVAILDLVYNLFIHLHKGWFDNKTYGQTTLMRTYKQMRIYKPYVS